MTIPHWLHRERMNLSVTNYRVFRSPKVFFIQEKYGTPIISEAFGAVQNHITHLKGELATGVRMAFSIYFLIERLTRNGVRMRGFTKLQKKSDMIFERSLTTE